MRYLLAIALLGIGAEVQAQEMKVSFTVDPTKDTFAVSPYITGSNGQPGTFSARRAGGNRWTGYNWETNASNAGTDYLNESDDYMTYQLPPTLRLEPGVVPLRFFLDSHSQSAYSLVTLPAAGYVAADESGPVAANETAPSARWKQVVFQKSTPVDVAPDTTDGYVYVDEEINSFVQSLGVATLGKHGYACDNEPALWPSTHPRIHPAKTTCAEVIAKDSAIGQAIRRMDPSAEVFGPVAYGFNEFISNQDATDWKSTAAQPRWIDAYLSRMHQASVAAGKRLLDVLDLHWYPEAQGLNWSGQLQRIAQDTSTSPGVRRARMDAPRSLWDSTYKENSWIGQYFSPVALIPWLKASISNNYPGTKLAFTELNYGGENDISGTVAIADVLGIFGKYGVYMSNYWGNITPSIMPAYTLYSSVGDINARATTSNSDSTSIYARSRSGDPNTLDVILINRSLQTSVAASITTSGFVVDTLIEDMIAPFGGTFKPAYYIHSNFYKATLPPMSVQHQILHRVRTNAVAASPLINTNLILHGRLLMIQSPLSGNATVTAFDELGRKVFEREVGLNSDNVFLPIPNLPEGVYSFILQQGTGILVVHRGGLLGLGR